MSFKRQVVSELESDFGKKIFGNVRFWANSGQKILLILVKTAAVVTKRCQEIVENAGILLLSDSQKNLGKFLSLTFQVELNFGTLTALRPL